MPLVPHSRRNKELCHKIGRSFSAHRLFFVAKFLYPKTNLPSPQTWTSSPRILPLHEVLPLPQHLKVGGTQSLSSTRLSLISNKWILKVFRLQNRVPMPPSETFFSFQPMPLSWASDRSVFGSSGAIGSGGYSSITILREIKGNYPICLQFQKNRKDYPILDLKVLNAFERVHTFQMESLSMVALPHQGDLLASIDIEAYLHVPIFQNF